MKEMNKLDITKEELKEMYWGEEGTERGAIIIADRLGCHPSTVYRYLKKYGIPTRPPTTVSSECITAVSRRVESEKASGENNYWYGKERSQEFKNNLNKLTKKQYIEIYQEYKNNKITIAELAREYSVSETTISNIVSNKHWATKDLKPIKKDDKE